MGEVSRRDESFSIAETFSLRECRLRCLVSAKCRLWCLRLLTRKLRRVKKVTRAKQKATHLPHTKPSVSSSLLTSHTSQFPSSKTEDFQPSLHTAQSTPEWPSRQLPSSILLVVSPPTQCSFLWQSRIIVAFGLALHFPGRSLRVARVDPVGQIVPSGHSLHSLSPSLTW